MFRINRNKDIKKFYNQHQIEPQIEPQDNKFFSEFQSCLKYLQTPLIKFQKGNNKFIFQTEQLTREEWKNNAIETSKYSILLEYSEYNKKILLENNHNAHVILCPIFLTIEMMFNVPEKIFDFVFIGSCNERRNFIIEKIKKKGFSVLILNNNFDFNNKYEEILKAKCLINIHYNEDYKVFEFARCTIPCFNNMIIVSENCDGLEYEKNNPVNKLIIDRINFSKYEDLVETAIMSLNKDTEILDISLLQDLSEIEKNRINNELKNYL